MVATKKKYTEDTRKERKKSKSITTKKSINPNEDSNGGKEVWESYKTLRKTQLTGQQ